jgi:hypothetical protein
MKKRLWNVAVLVAAVAAGASIPLAANAAAEKRPMALMVMFDGLRADGIESGAMPNVMALRNGTWQTGYKGAWSLTAQIAPGSDSASAPNHVSIATGFTPARHGVTANGGTAKVNYTTYPTWLKRVIDAKSGATAAFAYSWGEDADLGPAAGVTFLGGTDAQNATDLAALLASSSAPDATMFFINEPDAGGHAGNYYPYTTGYRNSLAASDGYLGQCLSAIASRPTFADEDWLILVTSDHGGYQTTHGNAGSGTHGITVPIVIAGTSVTAGRIPGLSYNFDVCASALAHFGITVSAMEATARDGAAETARPISAGLAAYLPFDEDFDNKITGNNVTTEKVKSPAITAGGRVGSYCNIPSGSYLRLKNSQSLTYEGGDKSYTAIVWVKMSQVSTGDPVILANKNWSGEAVGTLLCAGKLLYNYRGVALNSGSGSGRIDIGPYHVEGNTKWTFYAISRWDDGTHIIYQGRSDGTLNWNAVTFDAFVLKSSYPFCIGQDGTGNYGLKFVGGVDDVALWTRALRHEDIRLIYENGLSGLAISDLFAPATAVWTGAGSDPSDPADPANWACADEELNPLPGKLPGRKTDVTISGATTFNIASGKLVLCKSVLFDNVTLSSDRDWSGLDVTKIANGSRIDLCGKRLTLKGVSGANVAANVCTITDSTTDTANPGVLEINTPSGVTFENKAIAITGNIHFLKSGAGTYVASVATQTYAGGTSVGAGTAKLGTSGLSGTASARPYGPIDSVIEVASGAAIDAYGYDINAYHIVLAGGKLLNSYHPSMSPNDNNIWIGDISLKADSEITYDTQDRIQHDFHLDDKAVWDLGGHTLTIRFQGYDPDFEFYTTDGDRNKAEGHLTIKNGTVKAIGSSGWWHNHNTDGTDGGSYDIGVTLRHYGESTVSNLTFSTSAELTTGTGIYHVYGTFLPESACFHNVEMLDGSTIDLSGKTGAWNSAYSCSNDWGSCSCAVTFKSGATVTVDLTGREAEMEALVTGEVDGNEGRYVISWTKAHKPTAVRFVPKMADARKYKLSITNNGLRIRKPKQLVILVN